MLSKGQGTVWFCRYPLVVHHRHTTNAIFITFTNRRIQTAYILDLGAGYTHVFSCGNSLRLNTYAVFTFLNVCDPSVNFTSLKNGTKA